MAHASLRLLLSVALFSSCGKTLPVNIADPRTWFIDPNELILSVNITQIEKSTNTIGTPVKITLADISSSSILTDVAPSSQAPKLSVVPSSRTKLSQKKTELTSPSKLPMSTFLSPENEVTPSNISLKVENFLPSRFNQIENGWRVYRPEPPSIPKHSSKTLNISAPPTTSTPSQQLLPVISSRTTFIEHLESAELISLPNKFTYSNVSLQLQVPGISNSAMTTKHIISTSKNESASPEETKLETTHIAPTLSPNISNVVLTQELLASNVPKFQNSEIEAAKKTLIRPTNIFLQSNLTIPLQSTNTTKLISPPLVPQVIFKTNVTNSTKSNTPLDETRFSVETPLNLSLVKASLPLKSKESSREATVKLIVAPVNIFMSNQIYLQSTESSSVVPKLMVKTNNVTSINYTTTPSMVNVSPSHDESQNISFLSVLSNNTILTPIKDSPLSNSESYNATLTSISKKTSASSIFLSPPVTLSHTKAPINNGNSSFNSHGNETNALIGNTKGSNRKRRLRGRQSTKTEHKVVKNCNQCELCKRDKPICAKPVGVDGGDNQLRGFPSMCHLDCSNNCRKIHYEKVADGRCGRLRNWFQPLGSVSRLNRVELGKLEYQLTPGSTKEYAFLPLS